MRDEKIEYNSDTQRIRSLKRGLRGVGYWRSNLVVILCLMSVWAIVSFGCSVWLIDSLNQYKIGSLPLGFWFAQQGSIYVFVVLIFVYAFLMDWLDRKYNVEE